MAVHTFEEETGAWNQFEWMTLGQIVAKGKKSELVLQAREIGPEALVNIRRLRLTPVAQD
jgi:hypothetical protein